MSAQKRGARLAKSRATVAATGRKVRREGQNQLAGVISQAGRSGARHMRPLVGGPSLIANGAGFARSARDRVRHRGRGFEAAAPLTQWCWLSPPYGRGDLCCRLGSGRAWRAGANLRDRRAEGSIRLVRRPRRRTPRPGERPGRSANASPTRVASGGRPHDALHRRRGLLFGRFFGGLLHFTAALLRCKRRLRGDHGGG